MVPRGTVRGAEPLVAKVAGDPMLQLQIMLDLKLGRSPKMIAGWLAAESIDVTGRQPLSWSVSVAW